jgi:hypothetical protein
MRPPRLARVAGVGLLLAAGSPRAAIAWGALGHERVAGAVTSMLPSDAEPLLPLGPSLVRYAMAADRQRQRPGAERVRHHFYVDAYPWLDRFFVPARRESWDRRFGPSTVAARGLLPWAVADSYQGLVAAMRAHNLEQAGRSWADLTHYLGDACDPLRATRQADSLVAARVDTELLIRYRPHLELPTLTRRVGVVRDPFHEAVRLIETSGGLAPRILQAEQRARREGTGSPAYYARLWHDLGPTIADQLGLAAEESARFGYSAWVAAGRPDLGEGER